MPSICEIHVSLATYMLEVACGCCCCCCSINLLASSSLIVVVVDAVAAVAAVIAAAAAAIKSARISVGRQEEINI